VIQITVRIFVDRIVERLITFSKRVLREIALSSLRVSDSGWASVELNSCTRPESVLRFCDEHSHVLAP
jgi:hypothetical protein